MPAASAGETGERDCGLSPGLAEKLFEELLLGVPGREEFWELSTDGGYHESVGISWGLGWASWSWEPLR